MKHSRRNFSAVAASLAAFTIVSALVTLPSFMVAHPRYSDWSDPTNLGPRVNSAFEDNGPTVSRDGLSLYFGSQRPGGVGAGDIWVTRRNNLDAPWGLPANVTLVNSTADDVLPNLSRDGHWLAFQSRREGGYGNFDIWLAFREHVHDDFGWQPPVNVGAVINDASSQQNPFFFDNEEIGPPQLYFTMGLPSDLFVSILQPNGAFGPGTPVIELNRPEANERGLSIRFDGREVFFMSTRTGGSGAQDLWMSTRSTVFDSWSEPENLGPIVNSVAGDLNPFISSDRVTLHFNSDRAGGFGGQDLYVTSRTKENR